MTNLVKKLSDLKEMIDRAEKEKQEAEGAKKLLLKSLKKDYKVSTIKEAEKKLDKLDNELDEMDQELNEGIEKLEEKING